MEFISEGLARNPPTTRIGKNNDCEKRSHGDVFKSADPSSGWRVRSSSILGTCCLDAARVCISSVFLLQRLPHRCWPGSINLKPPCFKLMDPGIKLMDPGHKLMDPGHPPTPLAVGVLDPGQKPHPGLHASAPPSHVLEWVTI